MPLFILLVQCVAMFVASVVVGGIPLFVKSAMTGARLKAISVLGMGILVGAALTIIIPEGVSTLYGSLPEGYKRREDAVTAIGLSLLAGFALMLLIESLTPHHSHDTPSPSSTFSSPSPPASHTPLPESNSRDSNDSSSRPLPHHLDSRAPIMPKRMHVHDAYDSEQQGISTHAITQGLGATLGLVIHAAADGIALGASSRSGNGGLSFIVFMAVLVHKGPTALGLTTTLLTMGLKPPAIRHRLLAFSISAPIGAILTYMLVGAFGGRPSTAPSEVDGLGWWTGIALLFSAGSFLYVATVIQPLSDDHSHDDSAQSEAPPLSRWARIVLLFLGMIIPIGLRAIFGDDD